MSNTIIIHFNLSPISVSGCVVMGPNELLCTEAYYAIKTTLPLIALLTCCWMSFEAVLGNKEFEFVVSKVTLTVVTRRSTSGGHGVSVIVSVTGSGSDSLEAQTVSLVLITSATSLLSGSKNVFFNPKDSSYLYLLPSLLVKKNLHNI